MRYGELITNGLRNLLIDKRVILLGEDIVEPYGGAFSITKGLSLEYSDRVVSTPMSESALTGIVTGMALNGHIPILEIMFGDFITLCADGLINHASKFVGLYGKELHMVIRTPMGGYRGYGATHSQTLEKIFFGIPNLYIYACNILEDPRITLADAVNLGNPVLFIENKIDYNRKLFDQFDKYDVKCMDDFYYVNIKNEFNCDGYIVLYGGMVTLGLELIMDIFLQHERNIGLIVPTIISPINQNLLDIAKNKDLYVLDESNKYGGFSSEIARLVLENNLNVKSFKILSSKNVVIPSARQLEEYILPTEKSILQEFVNG